MSTSREAFEAAAAIHDWYSTARSSIEGRDYSSDLCEFSWRAWQAAMRHAYADAAEVCSQVRAGGNGTPKGYEDTHEDGHLDGCNECEWAIRERAKEAGNA